MDGIFMMKFLMAMAFIMYDCYCLDYFYKNKMHKNDQFIIQRDLDRETTTSRHARTLNYLP